MIFPNYNRSILSTTASILRHFGVNSLYPTLPEVDAALATGPKHVALVLADGAGVRPMEKNLPDGAYLRRMRAATVTSVFPSTTTAAKLRPLRMRLRTGKWDAMGSVPGGYSESSTPVAATSS